MALSSVFASSTKDEKENHPIPIQPGDKENTHIFRAPITIPLECWYYGTTNSILINCLTTIDNLKIQITNEETGDSISEILGTAYGSIFIPIPSIPGYYSIVFIVNRDSREICLKI